MSSCYKLFIITLFIPLISTNCAQDSVLSNTKNQQMSAVMKAIEQRNSQDLETALIHIKDRLNIEDQKKIAQYATKIRTLADKNAWLSSDTKKQISSTLCLLAVIAGGAPILYLLKELLFIIGFHDYAYEYRRPIPWIANPGELHQLFRNPLTYMLALTAFSFLAAAFVLGYDNMTDYYSERERFIQNFVYNNLPYFKQQLPSNSRWRM